MQIIEKIVKRKLVYDESMAANIFLNFAYINIVGLVISWSLFTWGKEVVICLSGLIVNIFSIWLFRVNVSLQINRVFNLFFYCLLITYLYITLGGPMGVAMMLFTVLPTMFSFIARYKWEYIGVSILNIILLIGLFVFWYWFQEVNYVKSEFFKPAIVNTTSVILISILIQIQFVKIKDSLLSEKIKAEKNAVANQQFLATMSHEIRTPLHGIVGALEIFESVDEKERIKLIEVLKQSTKNLHRMVNDVIDVTKMEVEVIQPNYELVDLEKIISNCILLLENSAYKSNGVSLNYEIQSEVSKFLLLDKTKVRQILDNLVMNALKFTEIGSVTILAQTKGTNLVLTVKDTGIGLKNEDAQKLINDGILPDAPKKLKGAGLGLKIVQNLTKILDGKIEVSSRLKEGLSFSVYLPLQYPEGKVRITDKLNGFSINKIEKKNALIIDDDAISLLLGKRLLQLLDFNVYSFNNSPEGIEFLKENLAQINFIFSDIEMPYYNGIQVAQIAREQALKINKKDLIIVALTANSLLDSKMESLQNGMDYFITKPFTLKDLHLLMDEIQVSYEISEFETTDAGTS